MRESFTLPFFIPLSAANSYALTTEQAPIRYIILSTARCHGSLPLGCCRLVLLKQDRQIRRQTSGSGDARRARPAQVVAGKTTTLNRGTIGVI
jgi:hypothetical protein